ncbi:MAG TPA: DUF3108 domain-containing protein [Bryobacteraceae bacterium]|jgi:hypothetical protein|nr:DUF3108 domain-containing protein [Bryobacteraceae bacterium]
MKYLLILCVAFLASASGEVLHFTINWPSGLSLGEASLRSDRTGEGTAATPGWDFELNLDASVPGFAIRDQYRSTANLDFCSEQLQKKISRGTRKNEERVTFDPNKNTAIREGVRDDRTGGRTEISVPSCARDALTLLQFVRKELAQGRLPPQQPAILGAAYNVRLEFLGSTPVRLGNQQIEADRFRTSIKGPASDLTLELFFAHDAVRTPVMVKIPLSLATFTVELIP